MTKYKTIPEEVEAVQFLERHAEEYFFSGALLPSCYLCVGAASYNRLTRTIDRSTFYVRQPGGIARVHFGDWIVATNAGAVGVFTDDAFKTHFALV